MLTSSDYAKAAAAEMYRTLEGIGDNAVRSVPGAYCAALAELRATRGVKGTHKAVNDAILNMAKAGITHTTYTRRDGTLVRVPVDVAIRRAARTSGTHRLMEQTLEIAKETGSTLVEVSITGNARPSHAEWEGQVYSLDPNDPDYDYFYDAVNWGDDVDGIGGYNCGHTFTIYNEGHPRAYSDPLEGTGYTNEEAAAAKMVQRRMENEIRKLKREKDSFEAAKIGWHGIDGRISKAETELKRHIWANKEILRRERWREGIGRTARKRNRMLGSVYLSAGQKKDMAKIVSDVLLVARADMLARVRKPDALKVSKQKQNKHILGTKEHEREEAKRGKISYMTLTVDEINDLILRYAGTGKPMLDKNGMWNGREVCIADGVIGMATVNGKYVETRKFVIVYAKKSVHVYPKG